MVAPAPQPLRSSPLLRRMCVRGGNGCTEVECLDPSGVVVSDPNAPATVASPR